MSNGSLCSSGAVALVALMVAVVGCVGAEETPSLGEVLTEGSSAPAAETTIETAPSFDDLAGPAVDENDPASIEARALFELVGPDPAPARAAR